MVYTLYVLWTIFCIASLAKVCVDGKGFKCERKVFPCFLIFSLLEGLAMITTLTPPTGGLIGGFLMGVWLWRHIVAGNDLLSEKVYTAKQCWFGLLSGITYFAAITIYYFFLLGS